MIKRLSRMVRAILFFPIRLILAPFTAIAHARATSSTPTEAAITDPLESSDEPYTMTFEDFMENVRELRTRFFRAMIGLVLGTTIGFFLAGPVLEALKGPYCRVVPAGESCTLVTLGPTSGIVVYFRVALMIGAILAIPIITYQILMFVLPGLTQKERRFVLWSIPPVSVLFIVGAIFAWVVLMPPALGFLQGFQPTIFKPEWTADLYLSFVTSLIFWMGVAFETPLIFFILSLMGIVDSGALIRNWRFAVVGASIAAAVITPTIDPVNMILVMGPLLALYVLSIILVSIGRRMSGVETVDSSKTRF